MAEEPAAEVVAVAVGTAGRAVGIAVVGSSDFVVVAGTDFAAAVEGLAAGWAASCLSRHKECLSVTVSRPY